MLVARASHVTYCLRFRLAQRYLRGVNQRAFTNRNRTNWRGECRRPPDHEGLTPFLQDPIIGTTVCVIDHWKHKIFSSYLSVFFPSYSLITVQSNLVVTCTTSCTCHHETDLAWVSSFNNICFKHKVGRSSQTRQFRGLNLHCENRILWFAPHTFTFPQNICQMVSPKSCLHIHVCMCALTGYHLKIQILISCISLSVLIRVLLRENRHYWKWQKEAPNMSTHKNTPKNAQHMNIEAHTWTPFEK